MHLVSVSHPSSSMDPRNNPHMAGYYQQPPHTNGYAPHPQYPPHPQAPYGGYQWGYPASPAGYDHQMAQAPMTQHQQQPPADGVASTPQQELISPHENDVLMGRGGKNNQHLGNERLRDMARAIRDRYRASAKKGKSNMSRDLVQQVRDLTPPGRFLKRNPITNEWEDVGDDIAREKVSQVLRDAVSEYCGPKSEKAGGGGESKEDKDDDDNDDEPEDEEEAKPEEPKAAPTTEPAPAPAPVDSAPKQRPELIAEKPIAPAPRLVSTTSLDLKPVGGANTPTMESSPEELTGAIIDDEDDYALALAEADDFLSEMDSSANEASEAPSSPATAAQKAGFKAKQRKSWTVPVQPVPWSRNKRKTGMFDRYANMNMGLSSSDMSIGSLGSQLSSRNLGTQLSSRQLMSSGARQMSSRQLSSRQLSSRQLSSRQLSSRQLGGRQASGRQMMSMDRRKQAFSMMGESDLSLESLSISGVSGHTNKSRSRKNVFMQQYQDMDMGLSDFSLNSLAGTSAHPTSGAGGFHVNRPSVIIEGDLEELSNHGSAHLDPTALPPAQSMEQYSAAGIGTSISNMTMNSIGTFTGHSRMSRGLFSMGPSMRMDSARSFLTTDDLQLDMLDDELFHEFAAGADEYEGNEEDMDEGDEFSSDFC